MSRVNVENEVEITEKFGIKIPIGQSQTIKVRNHKIWSNQVVIEVDRQSFTVIASDLEKAIKNSTGN